MFQRVSGTKLYEEVIRQIKDMIAQGQYTQGDRLPSEKELVEMMGVSRITVREALRILSNMGIIETQKGKGSFVAVDGGSQAMREIFSENLGPFKENFEYSCKLRMMLEPEVARQAARIASPEDIRRLERIIGAGECAEARQGPKNIEMDEFHLCLLQIVDNNLLVDLFQKLLALENTPMKVPMTTPERQQRVAQTIDLQHRRILKAVQEHNEEFAYFYMKEHVSYLFDCYREYFQCFFE